MGAMRQRRRPSLRSLGVLALTVALGAVVSAAPAAARRPGAPAHNGQITFGRYDFSIDAFSLWVADPNGGHERRLTTGPASFSDWSPDGRLIAFDFADDAGDVHLAVIRPDGTGRRTLTTAPGIQEVPSWSPDGAHIAYDAYEPAQPVFSTSIWLMNSDGSGQRRLTFDGFDVEPSFAPDGAHIAFGRIAEDRPTGAPEALVVVATDGSDLRQVVPPTPGLEHPDWSPDGQWILFNIGPEDRSIPNAGSILVVRPDGTDLHVLRAASEHQVFAKTKWSPDGRQLLSVCFDDRVGVDQLCSHRADGRGPVRTVRLDPTQWVNFPAWGPRPHRH
jgi:Tol biopolymer transport system component